MLRVTFRRASAAARPLRSLSASSASVFPPLEDVREVRNQVYPLTDYNAFETDLPLR